MEERARQRKATMNAQGRDSSEYVDPSFDVSDPKFLKTSVVWLIRRPGNTVNTATPAEGQGGEHRLDPNPLLTSYSCQMEGEESFFNLIGWR